jgi:DNA-binding response OmpR family regulator
MAEILRTRRLGVIIADDSEHALTLARTAQPDLILVDTATKPADATQLCDWLKTGSTTAATSLIIVPPKGQLRSVPWGSPQTRSRLSYAAMRGITIERSAG